MNLQHGTRLGPYVIARPLGHGGMGNVFEAHDPRLNRRVAIKTLRPELLADSRARRRFDREARAISALSHPNICAVFDVGHQDGADFLVMEYVDGEPLSTIVERRPLDEATLVGYAGQIADAVAEAHDHGILHRDIKPHNVMITSRGHVKVLDFGLATVVAGAAGEDATISSLSTVGERPGTPAYMSPEQVRGEPLDAATDVFSFGILLYEALSGRNPFRRTSAVETMSAILSSAPAPIRQLVPAVSSGFERVIAGCLERERARRPTFRQIARELDTAKMVASGPPAASQERPGAATPSGQRWGARTGLLFGTAALIVLALASGAEWLLRSRGAAAAPQVMAVLPLKPLTTSAGENAYGLGIADSLITRLSGNPRLTVRPTSAIRRYATQDVDALAAARELGADVVLDGSWHRDADRFRITANLLRVVDGLSLWAHTYDFSTADLFAIQDDVSKQMVGALRLQLDPERAARMKRAGTSNPEAYEAFARGQFYFSDRGFSAASRTNSDKAITMWQRAVQLDPDYAQAHASLGYGYAWTAIFIEDNAELIDRARTATDRAERLEPALGLVHLTRGLILWSKYQGWRLREAIPEFRRVAVLDPELANMEIATVYIHLGLIDDWKRLSEAALQQDPLNRQIRENYVNDYFLSNQPEEGVAAQRRLLNQEPDKRYFLLTRRVAEAERTVLPAAAQRPEDGWALADLAMLRALQGRHREAQDLAVRALERTQRNRSYHHQTYTVARVFALGGDAANAARWLRETIAWGMPAYPIFTADALLAPVRDSAEVSEVMETLRQEWQRDVALLRAGS
jgi:serine/threonine-protein kinase